MKKWERPKILNLILSDTSSDVCTAAWGPISWACMGCFKIYYQEDKPTEACDKCGGTTYAPKCYGNIS